MASKYIGLPGTGAVDPTAVGNAHYQYNQASIQTQNNSPTEIYRDGVTEDGIYLFEIRVVGVQSATANAVFKRSFTVYRVGGLLSILAVQSDYTFKTDAGWTIAIVNDGAVTVSVTGHPSENVNWVLTVTKTMGF